MRIDFSLLEEKESIEAFVPQPLNNSLHNFWKKESFQEEYDALPAINQESHPLSFSVRYPYEVTRSLSPAAITKELSYLKANRVLPSSTLKFIQNAIEDEREKERVKTESEWSKRDSRAITQYTIQSKDSIKDLLMDNQTTRNHKINKTTVITQNPLKKKSKITAEPRVYLPKKQPPPAKRNNELDEVTLRPLLNYTMNSRAAKQTTKNRKQRYSTTNSNVFLNLYNDAKTYQQRRLSRERAVLESRSIDSNGSRKSAKSVNQSFEDRYYRSLEKIADRKKKAQRKIDFDEEGRQYFQPNTFPSKFTYFTLFKPTVESLQTEHQQLSRTYRHPLQPKDSSKFNYSQEMTTALNKSCEFNSSTSNQESHLKIIKLRMDRLAELYADLLWKEESLSKSMLTTDEEKVLSDFLEGVQHFQYSRAVSRQVFLALFKEFFNRLNLYDRSILQSRLKTLKKQQKQQKLTQTQPPKTSNLNPHSRNWQSHRSKYTNLDHKSKYYFI